MPKQTWTQYTVPTYDKPGMLAKLTGMLYKRKINITAMMTESFGDVAYIRLLTETNDGLRKVLESAGYCVMETPCFWVTLPNEPGELNNLTRALKDENINIHHAYGTTNNGTNAKMVFVVDNPEKAAPIFAKWTEKTYAAV